MAEHSLTCNIVGDQDAVWHPVVTFRKHGTPVDFEVQGRVVVAHRVVSNAPNKLEGAEPDALRRTSHHTRTHNRPCCTRLKGNTHISCKLYMTRGTSKGLKRLEVNLKDRYHARV